MNFYFPDHQALCLAENATHNLHNLLTLRGAQVRDPRIWSRYLAEAMELFARRSDVAFASHHWPTWGADNIITYLAEQRDLYAYLHDQTLRLINQGYVGSEIAEMLEMPPGLDEAWQHARLLRVGQPQRQGHLPALPGLVRRQPGAPVAAPARRGGRAVREGHRRGGRHGGQGDRLPGERRPALRRRAGEPRRLRRPRQRDGPPGAPHGPDRAGLWRRVRHLAQLLPHRGPGAVPRDRAHGDQLGGDGARRSPSPSCSTPSPSGSTGPRRGTSTCASTGRSRGTGPAAQAQAQARAQGSTGWS